LLFDSVEDGELLPFVVLHSLTCDRAGLLHFGIFSLGRDLKELDWLTAGIQIPSTPTFERAPPVWLLLIAAPVTDGDELASSCWR
jgi:hypothetical protein